MAQLFDERLAAGDAIHAIFIQRRIALDGQDIVALVFLDRLLERGLRRVARRRHQRVVIIKADHRQHHILGQRMGRADEAFRAAGAFQAMHPDDGGAGLGLHRMGDLGHEGRAKAKRGRRQRAILHEAAAGDPLPAHDVIEGFDPRHTVLPGLRPRHAKQRAGREFAWYSMGCRSQRPEAKTKCRGRKGRFSFRFQMLTQDQSQAAWLPCGQRRAGMVIQFPPRADAARQQSSPAPTRCRHRRPA